MSSTVVDRLRVHNVPQNRILVALGAVIVAGVISLTATLLARPSPIDARWATYEQPTVVGILTSSNGPAVRDVDEAGVPVVYDDLVHLTFERCGPVAPVFVVSLRTWTLEDPSSAFIGIGGDRVSAEIGENGGGCRVFELDYEIPEQVLDRIERINPNCAVGCRPTPITVRFTLTPLDPSLGPITVESEQFHRFEELPVGEQVVSESVKVGD